MYEPNKQGGDKPGDDKPGGDPTGKCKCVDWPIKTTPEEEPFRRFLLALKEAIKDLPDDAVEKFEGELKDAEKESQGVAGVVGKYKEFYDKQLDCRLAEAKNWKAEIARLLEGKITKEAKAAINDFRKKNYGDFDEKICCEWIVLRYELNEMRDCLEQAKRKEEEGKQDYENFKGFEKTLGERFASLKALFDQAKALAAEQRYQAVYAVSLEFDDIYNNLGFFRDWAYVISKCLPDGNGHGQTGEGQQQSTEGGAYAKPSQPEPTPPETAGYGEQPTTPTPPKNGAPDQSAEGLKTNLKPDDFKKRLVNYLRALVLAKYQRFRWQQEFQTKTADTEKGGKACQDFRKERQKQFIDEADDIPAPTPSGGGSDDYGEKPPPDDYVPETPPPDDYVPETPPTGGYPQTQTGDYPQTPPAGGGYEQKPPAGNYPDKPTPPYGGYKDTPAPKSDTYPGRQKK